MAAAGYDPGKMTRATQAKDGTWRVPSFRGEGEVYLVNLELRSCSCPHHQHRQVVCKHLQAAATQATYVEYLEKASTCTDEQLEQLLVKYLDDPMVSGAIRLVRAERKTKPIVTHSETELKRVFA